MSIELNRKKVFLVYDPDTLIENQIALKLKNDLSGTQLDIWPYSDTVNIGSIQKAKWKGVQEAEVVIVLLSHQFPNNRESQDQVYVARTFNKRIIPLMADSCWEEIRSVRYGMENLLNLEVIELYSAQNKPGSGYENGVKKLRQAIRQPPIKRRLNQHQVYVSHSHSDSAYAMRIVEDLRSEGFTSWITSFDVQGGDDWFEVMSEAIRASTRLVVCLSENIIDSLWIARELLLAEEVLEIPIIPMVTPNMVRDRDKAEVDSYLKDLLRTRSDINFLTDKFWFFPSPNYETQLQQLIDRLNLLNAQTSDRDRIFISYRRSDSQSLTERLYDRLILDIDERSIFLDTESIRYGMDFKKYIDKTLARTAISLVMIGPEWATVKLKSKNETRLNDPEDLVRVEVETALMDPKIDVIPVLVNDASMPDPDDLPDSLKPITDLNAAKLRTGLDFRTDAERLIDRIFESQSV